jgi:hypothetical protein
LGRPLRFQSALGRSAAAAHFASGHVHDSERSARFLEKESGAPDAPFHVVRVCAKQQNIDGHVLW